LRIADVDAVEIGDHAAISNNGMIRQLTFEYTASVAPTLGGRGCVRGMAVSAVLMTVSIVDATGIAACEKTSLIYVMEFDRVSALVVMMVRITSSR
jgi:hypothetical protein